MSSSNIPSLYLLNKNYSSWSLRAWILMKVFNIEFETVMLMAGTPEVPDLWIPAGDKLMLRAGPTGKVPALHVTKPSGENHIVFESLAIVEYLAEDYPLWPSDKFERAYARSLAAEMATSFGGIRSYNFNLREKRPFEQKYFNDRVQKDLTRLSAIWEELRSKAAGKDGDEGYLFGRFTALDAMYTPIMGRLRSYGLRDRILGKNSQDYIDKILNNEHFKEWEQLASQETEIIPSDEFPPMD
ncbi:hypothetical protein BGZ76_007552 [Entomortierella beljakovae]|nr:hypothetical protein BGZ76_007552 [Entomortierella beljakovae]